MSSTRNKRKRAENNDATPHATRRRTRDSRDDVPAVGSTNKNEAKGSDEGNDSSATTPGATTSTSNQNAAASSSDGGAMKAESLAADQGAGSSSQESSSSTKGPLHAENAETSNTSTENPNPDERTLRIQELIAHRTKLLSRIRLCRNAAEKRLSVTKSAEIQDEKEIEIHLQMSRAASQAARKARGEDAPVAENRSSLSLRRGSGVGKRMNAALSALAPGASPVAGAPSPVPIASGNSSFLIKPTKLTPAAASLPTTVTPKSIIPPSTSTLSKSASKGSKATTPRQPNSVAPVRPGVGKVLKGNSSSVSGGQRPVATSSKDLAASRSRIPQSKTIFPEAIMLRKRKEVVEGKLRAIMERQQAEQRSHTEIIIRRRHPRFDPLDLPPKSNLPKRRKTHWDRLLQEMNWLATDFIEERKWKASSGRIIGAALRASDFVGGKNTRKKAIHGAPIKENDTSSEQVTKTSKEADAVVDEARYAELSVEDTRHARTKSKLLSTMISELAGAIGESRGKSHQDKVHAAALNRYKKTRTRLLDGVDDAVDEGQSEKVLDESRVADKSNPQCGDVEMQDAEKKSNSEEKFKEVTFSEINKRIEKLHPAENRKEKFPYKELANATSARKFHLSDDQQKMVEFAERVWASFAGAALEGMPTSGKTVATCSLLWKHHGDGPQLVVCPPANILRWKYELCLFSDLRALSFGPKKGIGNSLEEFIDTDMVLEAGDVVLCEYSLVEKLFKATSRKETQFKTLCVDCRHATGMYGSLASQSIYRSPKARWSGANELLSISWWKALALLRNQRCLTIDYCDPDLYSLGQSGLGKREQLEVLSMRAALLLGQQIFRPSAYPLERTIISWARHQEKKAGEDKFERVRRNLKEKLSPFCHFTTQALSTMPTSWEIHGCEMSKAQRKLYDEYCCHVRGALSCTLGPASGEDDAGSTADDAVAASLIQLRQICLGINDYRNPLPSSLNPSDASNKKTFAISASQPSLETTTRLISGSGKLAALVSILRHDLGISMEGYDSIEHLLPDKTTPLAKIPRRVAILASLGRTRCLLSELLGSLGMDHQIVGTDTYNGSNSLSWAESQNCLMSFNLDEDLRDQLGIYTYPDVIVVSPDFAASWNGGIGLDKADAVIVLDEDWSGRENGTIEAALARFKATSKLRKTPTRLIRLVSEGSIEVELLNFHAENSTQFWPLDRSGSHILSSGISHLLPVYAAALKDTAGSSPAIPGIGILQGRGKPLEEILASTVRLEPLLDGSKALFLPYTKDSTGEIEIRKGLQFLKSLYQVEKGCVLMAYPATYFNTSSSSAPTPDSIKTDEKNWGPQHLATLSVVPSSEVQLLPARAFIERQILGEATSTHPCHGMSLSCLSQLGNKGALPSRGDLMGVPNMDDTSGPTLAERTEKLLLYRSARASQDGSAKSGDTIRPISNSLDLFLSWKDSVTVDGGQGSEPLVFFPPLLPKVQLAPTKPPEAEPVNNNSITSRIQMHASNIEKLANGSGSDVSGKKRQDVQQVHTIEHGSKRPRVEATMPQPSLPADENPMPGAVPALPEGSTDQGKQDSDTSGSPTTTCKVEDNTYDDFGLLGRGILPMPTDTALLMMNEVAEDQGTDTITYYDDEQEMVAIGNDPNSLDLISLYVKKRHRGFLHRTNGTLSTHMRVENAASRPSTINEAGKKSKNKSGGSVTPSAFSRLPQGGRKAPSVATQSASTSNGKDAPKHRMLATYVSRQYGTGLSMFESASFRIATMQVHSRVRIRANRNRETVLLSGESGTGLPSFAFAQPSLIRDVENGIVRFAPVVVALREGVRTGDTARAQAAGQLSAFRRSLSSPSRVDFGPFRSGFLCSTSGMGGRSPTRSRIGVSLPMGVKVSYSTADEHESMWSPEEDRLLKMAVVRFGLNWSVIARSLSGHSGFLIGDDGKSIVRQAIKSARASRQCRDRWHSLLRSQPSLAAEIRQSEKSRRDRHAARNCASIHVEAGTSIRSSMVVGKMKVEGPDILVNASSFKSMDEMHVENDASVSGRTEQLGRKPALARIKTALAKRQTIPLALPGIPPGGQPNQPVPSHPSHMQSVQSSAAAQWSNGRTELWPLQILDCADKHRAASTRMSSQRGGESPVAAPLSSRSAASSKRPSGSSGRASSSATSRVAPRSSATPKHSGQGRGQVPTIPPARNNPSK